MYLDGSDTATLLSLSIKTRICEGISLFFEFSVSVKTVGVQG
jgi:hypothetical protein